MTDARCEVCGKSRGLSGSRVACLDCCVEKPDAVRAAGFRVGQIVTSGEGADCYMGTVVDVHNRTREALVKYVDFAVPRLVRFNEIRRVGR